MSNQHDYEDAMAEVKQDLIAELQREQREEIARQDVKWGDQTGLRNGTGGPLLRMLADAVREHTQAAFANGVGGWFHIVQEETAEAFGEHDPKMIYAELLQVEACCLQWRIALLKQMAAGRTPDQDAIDNAMERGFQSILNALKDHPLVAEVHYRDMGKQPANPGTNDYPGASKLTDLPDGQITGVLNPDALWQGPFGWSEIFREREESRNASLFAQAIRDQKPWPPHNPYVSPGVENPDELEAIEPPAEDDDSAPWTIAAYSGSCSGCGEEIEPGDEIRAGHDGWEGRCCEL
jgi:hypothetical protein